jgi:hypothetical protein
MDANYSLNQLNPLLRALITSYLISRGFSAVADAFASAGDDEAYPIARVFSRDVEWGGMDMPTHKEAVDLALANIECARDRKVNKAFGFYTLLAYTGEEDVESELAYVKGHWKDVVEFFTPHVCASTLLEAGHITAAWSLISAVESLPTNVCTKCDACRRTNACGSTHQGV